PGGRGADNGVVIGHPRPRVGGPGRPAAASGGQLPGQGVGEGPAERARCGAGGWGKSECFWGGCGWGQFGREWGAVGGQSAPALLLEGLALRGWFGGAMGGRQDE